MINEASIDGTPNDDILDGSDGADIIRGYEGNDTLIGYAGDDTLDGGEGNDKLGGGDGNDTLIGDGGDDDLYGGDGVDTADYSGAFGAVIVDLTAGTAFGEGSDHLYDIENATGSAFSDRLTGNAGDNLLIGGAGNDTLIGGDGDDTLDGGDGLDTADYSGTANGVEVDLSVGTASGQGKDALASIERVIGSAYDDFLTGSENGNNQLFGGDGDDTLNGGAGQDWLNGGDGDDKLYGRDGWDVADYSDAANGVTADLGHGTASGQGNDILIGIESVNGGNYGDILIGDAGDNVLIGNGGSDVLDGGFGDDTLYGGDGDDVLSGGDGNDFLAGGAGDDTLRGDGGVDSADYSYAGDGVYVDLSIGTASGDGNDTLSGIENIYGSAHDDVLIGDAGNNGLIGGDGNDILNGGDGNDTLDGGAGNNQMFGGNGDDTYFVHSLNDNIVEYNNGGRDTVVSNVSFEIGILSVENLILSYGIDPTTGEIIIDAPLSGVGNDFDNAIYGNNGNNFIGGHVGDDHLYGNGGDDIISGDDGNDIIDGGSGNDSIGGSAGDDQLFGGDGNDIFDGGDGDDRIDGGSGWDAAYYIVAQNGVVVNLEQGTASGQGNDTLTGIEAVYGSAYDDVLIGDDESNQLDGGDGDDTLNGGASYDQLNGGDGDDRLNGGDGLDYAEYYAATNGVTVDLEQGTASGQGNDILIGIENVDGSAYDDVLIGDAGDNGLVGNNGSDTLDGRNGDDTLNGGDGHDTLDGGYGGDVLVGGGGADHLDGGNDTVTDMFVFANALDSALAAMDGIYGFTSGIDKIDLSRVDANTALAGDQAFVNGFGSAYTANGVWIVSDLANNSVTLYADVDGDPNNGADFAVRIVGVTTIAAADIVF